jgi:diguanylate cyclase (GGDEF)-like protein
MISAALDALCIGDRGAAVRADLRDAGLRVETADTLVVAFERLRSTRATLVVADGDVCVGREHAVFSSLRDAGVAATIALYPQSSAWRAPRAVAAGADEAFTLPAAPGAVRRRALALIEATRGSSSNADVREVADKTLQSLFADIAAINRDVGDFDHVLDEVVRRFAGRADAARCSLLLVDEERGDVGVAKAVGLPDGVARSRVPLGTGLAGSVAKTGSPLFVSDVDRLAAEGRVRTNPADAAGYRTKSCVVLPLRTSRGVIGVVCLSDKASGSAFEQSEMAPLMLLADQAAQTVENALQFRKMRDLATIDQLTGVGNRRHFDQMFERELSRAKRYGRRLTLALFDVDHFKKYNDACGHQAGDRALTTIGRLLRESLRDVDIVARYGGEEFAVILPETARSSEDGTNPLKFLERLRLRVERQPFPGEEALPSGNLTISGGVATYPEDGATVEELVRSADRKLYASKDRGRNSITSELFS